MNIIEVIPISKSIGKETLSYFTSESVAPGSIVKIPLRKKTVSGIVIDVKSAASAKSEIKSLPFEMKKVTGLQSSQFFLPEFIETCRDTAQFFASSTGSVLNALAPNTILEHIENLPVSHSESRTSKLNEKYIIQADDEERFAHYKSLIREQFAKKSSVFFCLPTIHDIEATLTKLEKGIEEYTYVLHASLPKKELLARVEKMLKDTHPILIVGTGTFLSLPRKDIGAIIIEKENSKSYKIPIRPYLDIRTFAEYYAKHIQAKLIMGDLFLQTETMFRYTAGELTELYPPKFRSLSTAQSTIVDMREQKPEHDDFPDRIAHIKKNDAPEHKPKKFTLISSELETLLRENHEQNERMYLFTARKGLSPTTLCGDCGTIVTCNACKSPVVLHASSKGNFFLCHKCGERRDANELCRQCGSWKLVTLGIGLERVADEIKKILPESKIFLFDKDFIKTHKKALSVISEFYNSPGSILLGTEMALLYLDQPVENSAIASIDALFSVPDFKINERILSIILKMRAITQRKLLLQTRDPEQQVFKHALQGNIIEFFRNEIDIRKAFDYPPFSMLIKLTLEGKPDAIAEMMGQAQEMLKPFEIDVFPSFIRGKRGQSILHGLIKIPREQWPNGELLAKLRTLHPQFAVRVAPETLL